MVADIFSRPCLPPFLPPTILVLLRPCNIRKIFPLNEKLKNSHMMKQSLRKAEMHQKLDKSKLDTEILLMLAEEVVVGALLQLFLIFVRKSGQYHL